MELPVSHQSLQAVALDPDFSKKRAKMYVTGGDKVITVLYEQTLKIQENHELAWLGHFISLHCSLFLLTDLKFSKLMVMDLKYYLGKLQAIKIKALLDIF